jgi:hypothetical protein
MNDQHENKLLWRRKNWIRIIKVENSYKLFPQYWLLQTSMDLRDNFKWRKHPKCDRGDRKFHVLVEFNNNWSTLMKDYKILELKYIWGF